jgi:DNA modification methylase
MTKPTLRLTPVQLLTAHPKNARTHSKQQIARIADSINRFGFTAPVIADEHNVILAGHGRWLAAKHLELSSVPVVVLSGLTHAQKRAYLLADNKLAEKAGWDRAALALELCDLGPLLAGEGLDLQITGFDAPEIDSLLGDLVDREDDPADAAPEIAAEAVSRTGDLWLLGKHRLLCGDARDPAHMKILMNGASAAMVFADPPYNVKVSSIQGRGKIKHREFVAGSGEMSRADFIQFLEQALGLTAQHSSDGSIHYVCMDWKHIGELLAAGERVYSELKNLIVWAKTNAGQGSFYRSQHELIFAFKNGDAPHRNNFELGQHGRHRSNLWTYAGVNTFRANRLDELAIHPTVKPVALVADAMRDCSRRGEVVLDPFVGSGTTILAAERVGRRGYGLDLDPLYVDAAVRRWQAFTRRDAVLADTSKTFDETALDRSSKQSRRRMR